MISRSAVDHHVGSRMKSLYELRNSLDSLHRNSNLDDLHFLERHCLIVVLSFEDISDRSVVAGLKSPVVETRSRVGWPLGTRLWNSRSEKFWWSAGDTVQWDNKHDKQGWTESNHLEGDLKWNWHRNQKETDPTLVTLSSKVVRSFSSYAILKRLKNIFAYAYRWNSEKFRFKTTELEIIQSKIFCTTGLCPKLSLNYLLKSYQ